MIAVDESRGALLFTVRVEPGSRRPGVRGEHDGMLRVAVAAVAEHGKANRAVLELLAASLGLAKSQLSIRSGETSRTKRIAACDVAREELGRRLAELIA